MEEIINVVWADRPPSYASNLVQKYVGQIRRFLGDASATHPRSELISLHPSGYQIQLPDDDVDLLRFRRAVAAAQNPEVEALESIVSALDLWRGQSFGGLPPSVRGHLAFYAIDAEYLSAVCRSARLGLTLGQSSRVLPALKKAVSWRPLDEKIHALWMLALAGAGRQAEALASYELIRHRLVEELGIDPGLELRFALQQVLHL
jgi:DNA-binding SARP family transcriptional activator